MRRKFVVLSLAVAGLFTFGPAPAGSAAPVPTADVVLGTTGYDWCC